MSKSLVRSFAAALIGLLVGSHSATAQEGTTTLAMGVVDSATRAPILGARVEVGGVARPAFTDGSGVASCFSGPAPRGRACPSVLQERLPGERSDRGSKVLPEPGFRWMCHARHDQRKGE